MKKIKAALFFAMMASVFCFMSCSDEDSGTYYETPSVELPASAGENPFVGKKFTLNEDEYSKETAEFTENEYIYSCEYKTSESVEVTTYSYSYNTYLRLLYLAFKKYYHKSGKYEESYSNINEDVSLCKEKGITGAKLQQYIEIDTLQFSTIELKRYSISGTKLSLTNYFSGKLPSDCNFTTDYTAETDLSYISREFYFHSEPGQEISSPLFFENETFHGTVYETKYNEDWSVVTGSVLGTVKGTYTTEGPGSDNCIIKFTFTELPEDFTYVSKNTEYTLEMY